ncbi:hypothetical protein GBAR_LOCUS18416 [Geodia barretti]|uniref:Uncharacterized protein n=1 Tax=Geodia barretti TaxID=519541 RepID=A0AA35WZV3_GEOBA|nr:hypothetical protein GBAR_LOCUS18416 [Geodia barretti]
MATSAMAGVSCLQVGPRQGVYCRPSVVLTAMPGGGYQQQYMSTGGGRLKWRLSQFKSPEHNYRLRARADMEENPPENIPQIAGRIIERPSSAASQQRATPKLPPKITKSHSSFNLHHATPYSGPLGPRIQPQQQATAGPGKFLRTSSGPIIYERHRKSSTAPVFSIQACSVTIQSRPLARSLTAPPKKIAPPDEPFPYPDPVLVGGDHTFNIRLAEMAGLQRETAKLEECRIRIARRNAAANTTGANASTQNSTASSSLQPNNPHQPGVRSSNGGANSAAQSVRPSSGVTRVSSRTGLSRKTSLPAGYTATAVQPPPQLPPPSSLPDLSQTTKDCPPVVKRTSSPLSSISECKRSSNSDASANPCPSLTDPRNKTPAKCQLTLPVKKQTIHLEKRTQYRRKQWRIEGLSKAMSMRV